MLFTGPIGLVLFLSAEDRLEATARLIFSTLYSVNSEYILFFFAPRRADRYRSPSLLPLFITAARQERKLHTIEYSCLARGRHEIEQDIL